VILGLVGADLVLSGTVRAFEDSAGAFGAPRVDFSAWVLDFVTGKLAWASTSSGSGDDGVFLFDLGRVTTANALACGMAKGTAELLLRNRSPVQGDRPTARLRRRGEGGAPSAHK
jgi:hypothetical protein